MEIMINYEAAKHVLMNKGRITIEVWDAAKTIVEFNEYHSFGGYATPHLNDFKIVQAASERIKAAAS